MSLLILILAVVAVSSALAEPPFRGTVFIDPDIITSSDPTTFIGIVPTGQGSRSMFDRRTDAFAQVEAHLFEARFSDGFVVEVQVNQEFDLATAARHAKRYCIEIGRIPTVLRKDVQTVWIHDGYQLFGGGNNNLLIHVLKGDEYAETGVLEEVFVHEAAHTSLDAEHGNADDWRAAQSADPEFISPYARDNPSREDIAETFSTWFAVAYRSHRISSEMADTITATSPNRNAYFDKQNFNMFPFQKKDMVVPRIEVTGPEVVFLQCNLPYTELGATATDDIDGDISENIVLAGDKVDSTTPGTYIVLYNVQDSFGNAAITQSRTVFVEVLDTIGPTISLLGKAEMRIQRGAVFADPGATAEDACDGVLTGNIVVHGDSVDTAEPGTYLITYTVEDSAGNSAIEQTRTVIVQD